LVQSVHRIAEEASESAMWKADLTPTLLYFVQLMHMAPQAEPPGEQQFYKWLL